MAYVIKQLVIANFNRFKQKVKKKKEEVVLIFSPGTLFNVEKNSSNVGADAQYRINPHLTL